MRQLISVLTVCTILVGLQSQNCQGQVVPYRLFGIGVADPVGGDAGLGSFYGPAFGRFIGPLYYYAQATEIIPIDENMDGIPEGFTYQAIDTQTAWDGSEIYLYGEGTATLFPRPDLGPFIFEAVWDGDWTILGGSGRFENAESEPGAIDLFVYFYPFDLTDNDTLRPFFYTKTGHWDLGWFDD